MGSVSKVLVCVHGQPTHKTYTEFRSNLKRNINARKTHLMHNEVNFH